MSDDFSRMVVKQLQTSEEFRQPRLAQIRENEDMVAGKVQPALKGRYNVPFDGVIAAGFVETLLAQVNTAPKLIFSDPKGSNFKSVKKIQALWERDSSPQKQNWAKIDRLGKRIAATSNICIFEYMATKSPKYKGILRVIDPYDFHAEPNGGADVEEHMYKGVFNQFRTKTEIENLAQSGYYDSAKVKELFNAYSKTDYKMNEELYKNKASRLQTLGLDIDASGYVGQEVFNLARWVTHFGDTQYYAEFDYRSGIVLKKVPLKEMFGTEMSPWVVWNPIENAFTIWGPGLLDQIKPVAEAMRINLNEILNNNRKRNWDMKAVDKTMFPDISALNWKQDGVVAANVPAGQSIQNGVYYFQTPEISGALNLNQYLNDFLGINTGISDQTKGQSSQDTLGIARINSMQVSKRMKLVADSYTNAYAQLGLRWDWGIHTNLDTDEAIKIIGASGVEFEKVTAEDTDPDYDISVITSSEELQENEQSMERKSAAMARIAANPALAQNLNPRWVAEQELRIGGWKEEDIRRAMDTKNDAYDETIATANKNIEYALEGKPMKEYRGATTGYLKRIDDFLNENEMPDKVRATLEIHFQQHVPIAAENQKRAMNDLLANTNQNGLNQETGGIAGEIPPRGGQTPIGGMGGGIATPPFAGEIGREQGAPEAQGAII